MGWDNISTLRLFFIPLYSCIKPLFIVKLEGGQLPPSHHLITRLVNVQCNQIYGIGYAEMGVSYVVIYGLILSGCLFKCLHIRMIRMHFLELESQRFDFVTKSRGIKSRPLKLASDPNILMHALGVDK